MRRTLVFAFGLINYLIFLGVFLYFVGFLGNFLVPRPIDGTPEGPLWTTAIINTLLVAVFGVQHTVMARPTFKKWWARIVPEPIERSTYVMFTNLALIAMFWQWRPLGGVVWHVSNPISQGILYGLFACGWLTVLITTFLIDHFDLFGMRQVWLYLRGKPYTHIKFRTPGPYRFVRHPLYVGWITAFWATPTMTIAHLLFATGMTAYILIAIYFEERNLFEYHGEAYAEYRRTVPMLIPRLARERRASDGVAEPVSTSA